MKHWFLSFITLLLFNVAKADTIDNWQIHLNNKLLLKSNAGSDAPAAIKLSFKDAKGSLKITYQVDAPTDEWNRSFMICDASGTVLLQKVINKNAGTSAFDMEAVKKVADNKSVNIYTVSLPNDPNIAATIRVRRTLLGTIAWK